MIQTNTRDKVFVNFDCFVQPEADKKLNTLGVSAARIGV
jgi:hypothetical protein